MTLIDHIPAQSLLSTLKDTVTTWRNRLFPMSMEAKIVWAILAAICLWGVAITTFGVPALVWPMMIIVPGMLLGLVLLTWGM